MLLNFSKVVFILFITTLFVVGCGTKYPYTNQSYHSSSYNSNTLKNKQKNYTSSLNNNSKIRNSKAMHRATMRPYEVFGKIYHPTIARINDEFRGIASWYGPDFHEKKTSNGEIYNMYADTAAHKTLPMNTIVRVTNLENGKSVIVRINDRGPFVGGRIIDLSNKSAHAIDLVKKGTANVRLNVLGFNGKIAKTVEEKQEVSSISNYYIQVGVFSKVEGANITKSKFDMVLEKEYKVILKDGKLNDIPIKRVWISGFRSEQEAEDFKENNNLKKAIIIAE